MLEIWFSCEQEENKNLIDIILQEQPFYVVGFQVILFFSFHLTYCMWRLLQDRYDAITDEWNKLRADIVRQAVEEMIVPSLEKELVEKLKEEARGAVLQVSYFVNI